MTDRVEYRFNTAADSFFRWSPYTQRKRNDFLWARARSCACQLVYAKRYNTFHLHTLTHFTGVARDAAEIEKKWMFGAHYRCQHISERTRTIYTALTIPFTDANMKNVRRAHGCCCCHNRREYWMENPREIIKIHIMRSKSINLSNSI